MKNTLYLFLALLLISCSSVKRSEKSLHQGNYDETIEFSIKKIQNGRIKNVSAHVSLLAEAFQKAVVQDVSRIDLLEKEGNSENSKEIYDKYLALERRQRLIRPLLPLEGETFEIKNYNKDIIRSKNNYADHLFSKGTNYLSKNNILDARKAHNYLSRLQRLQPRYNSNIDSLLEEAHYRGTDFVHVVIQNRTEQVIPKRLEQAILDFDTYKLDDFWTEYHSKRERNIDYTYGIVLDIREILVSPERINEKEYIRKKKLAMVGNINWMVMVTLKKIV